MTQDRHEDLKPIIQFINGTGGSPEVGGEWFGLVLTDLRLALAGAEIKYVDWKFEGTPGREFSAEILVFTADVVVLARYVTGPGGDVAGEGGYRGTNAWSRKHLNNLEVAGQLSIREQSGPGRIGAVLSWSTGQTSTLPLQPVTAAFESLAELIPSLLEDLSK